jgi:hypothetical protein
MKGLGANVNGILLSVYGWRHWMGCMGGGSLMGIIMPLYVYHKEAFALYKNCGVKHHWKPK